MTVPQLLEDNLARWIEPATVQLDNALFGLYLEGVRAMSNDLAGRELAVVRAAHGQLDDDIRSWVAARMREHDNTFVGEGKDALLVRLAAAAALYALDSRVDNDVTVVNLGVGSARYLGLTPVIADTADIAFSALANATEAVRARPSVAGTAEDTVQSLAANPQPNEEGVVPPLNAEEVDAGVKGHTDVLRALARHVDSIAGAYAQSLAVLDEEVEVLWWVLLGRDAHGRRWDEHPPLDRAVLAARELKARSVRQPGPSGAGYFLARALGEASDDKVSIAEIARAGASTATLPTGSDALTPIISTVACLFEVNGNDEIWPGLAESKFQIPVSVERSLAEAAEQLYRELHIAELLGA